MRDQNWGEPDTPYYRQQEKLWNLWIDQKQETVKRTDVRKYVVVSSAGLLVDLSAAGQLHALLWPGCVVAVPDVVREVLIRIGGRNALQWIRDHSHDGVVYLASTKVWDDYYSSGAMTALSESDAVQELVERLQGQGKRVEVI